MTSPPPAATAAHPAAAHPAAAHPAAAAIPPPPIPPPPMPPPPIPPPPVPPRNIGLVIINVVETTWRTSAIVLESGTCPSRMIWAPDLADLDVGPGERLANPRLEVLGIDRDPDQERDRAIGLVPEGQGGRPGHDPLDVPEARIRLVVEQLDVGDRRIGDDDPAEHATGLDDPGLALDQADLGLGLVDRLDQVGHVPGDLLIRAARRRPRRAFGDQARPRRAGTGSPAGEAVRPAGPMRPAPAPAG